VDDRPTDAQMGGDFWLRRQTLAGRTACLANGAVMVKVQVP